MVINDDRQNNYKMMSHYSWLKFIYWRSPTKLRQNIENCLKQLKKRILKKNFHLIKDNLFRALTAREIVFLENILNEEKLMNNTITNRRLSVLTSFIF